MSDFRLPAVRTDVTYVKFGGGLDLVSPVLSLPQGAALDAMNYEPGVYGGYRRIDGFERFDGRASPSDATYYYLAATFTGSIVAGNTVTGLTSGATGVAVAVDSNAVCLTKVTGIFVVGEALQVAGTTRATTTAIAAPRGYADAVTDATTLAAAADLYRADIGAVPGSGSILGVWVYQGVTYAFRNNAGATAAVMYKSSGTGWTAITLPEEISFTNANISVNDGDVLTQGAVTATVQRVVLETGSLASGTNTGRLIITARAGGAFASGAATSTGSGTLTLGGASTQITLLPNGRYEFVNYNFYASTATLRMYGCDGVNRAFEFDGTTFVPIKTGMTVDAPTHIAAHKKKLFLSFSGSLQNSGDGTPYQWSVVVGASEIGIGDNITGLLEQPGDTLAVFSRNSTWQLNGSTVSSFVLAPISPEVGAIAYTTQNLGVAYGMDDRGVTQITRTQAYGNFDSGTVSRKAQPVIDTLRSKAIASTVYKSRNQYRVFGNDGSGMVMTIEGDKVMGITQLQYPVNVTCACSCEDASGKDVVFFGASNGYVYQADKGSSFDGAAIEAYLRLPFSNINSPRYRKRYRKAVLEISAVGYSSVRFQPEFSYGDADVDSHVAQTGTVIGAGGYYDASYYESIFYDAPIVATPQFDITGTGLNMSMLFYSKSAIDLGHTIQGCLIHYSLRRLQR